MKILTSNRDLLEQSAAQLLVKETLDSNDLAGLFNSIKPAPTEFRQADVGCNC